MKLSERLQKIASLVTSNSTIADIGTDHGYIPIYLLRNNIINFAIAADINKGPLENAKKEVKANALQDKVDLRLGSGLKVIKKGEVEEVIIAGMGGVLISDIIRDSIEVAKSLNKMILQPMQSSSNLRKYLIDNGFSILDEVLVKEEFRIYEIIVAKYTGNQEFIEDEIYYEIGKKLIENKDPLLLELIDKRINEYKRVLHKIEGLSGDEIENKKVECMNKINKFEEMKKYAS
ncbi:tRNA (adenine(22)-N(1))-methyltransferase [Alkalithermobacter paradoxus]|uniref:tRNA (Adenine(22)-N(1))-methyltransferase n=1 Tax=Alkalithermobacter paradoxus TaxID=29349 RepID=A0A1V4IBQ0_9FIRM|nr:tRNA (adenine(22)-N(1))-methyltransferase [[Clostridium] thermoalcaliphilum]